MPLISSELPRVPAVYAMFGGRGRELYVVYVGIADVLRRRVMQHLVTRDSSVATGTSAACLNPDYVTQVWWWEHADFTKREVLEASEMVAFDILKPVLRSRGKISDRAMKLYGKEDFRKEMTSLIQGEPTGRLIIPTLEEALQRISRLEHRLSVLERQPMKK